ncbi:MAG: hypothetical protein Salg2KO_15710 [Salibacteraceae bacterium]
MKVLINITHVLGILAALLLAGCNTYEPPIPAGSTTPIFYAKGEINGAEFDIKADGEDYQADSRQNVDSLGVTLYSGAIKPMNCDQFICADAFALDFRGDQSLSTDVVSKGYTIRNALVRNEEDEIYTITLSPASFGSPENCTWIIDGDEVFTTTGSEALEIKRLSTDASVLEVELTGEFTNGCISSITDYVYLPNHNCDAKIIANPVSEPSHILFTAKTTNPSSYFWEFESGVTASSEEVEYRFNTIPNDGVETVSLSVTRGECEANRVQNVVVNDSIAQCNINLGYTITSELVVEARDIVDKDLETVQLLWVDKAGVEYRSELIAQPEWARFRVLSDDDYSEPLLGEEPYSKKVMVEFSAKLVSKNGSEIDLRNVSAVMPVGQYQ